MNLRNHLPPGDYLLMCKVKFHVSSDILPLITPGELEKSFAAWGFLFPRCWPIYAGKSLLFATSPRAGYSHAPACEKVLKQKLSNKESPWPARARMSAQRSQWRALTAKNVITLQRRIAATIQIAWNLRSSAHVARHQLFIAKPAK